MEPSKHAVKTEPTSATSRRTPSKPQSTGKTTTDKNKVRQDIGNNVLKAMVYELQSRGYSITLHNVQVDGMWVAHLQIPGQMWTDDGDLKESELCKKQ